jgi:hypothetical protein
MSLDSIFFYYGGCDPLIVTMCDWLVDVCY